MRHMAFTKDEGIAVIAERAATRLPDGVVNFGTPSSVLAMTDPVVSYAQLAGLVEQAAGWAVAAGIGRGDRVVISKPNHPDIFVLAAGVSRAGGVPVLLSNKMAPEHARVVIGRVQPSLMFIDRATAMTWALETDRSCRLVLLDGSLPEAVHLDELRGGPAPLCQNPAFTDVMIITHTSGTTGVPKLVAHSAFTISDRAKVATLPVPIASIRRRDRYAASIAWNHARAMDGMICWLHVGCPLLAISDPTPSAVAPLLAGFRPTIVEAIANQYLLWEGLAKERPELFAQTRVFANAFDAIHPRSVRTMLATSERAVPMWFQAYGQSEVGCASLDIYTRRTVHKRSDRPVALRSMGWAPMGLVKVRITDRTTGATLPARQVGEIEVRSNSIALDYVGQEDLNRRQRHDGWWRTGDVGFKDRSGRIILNDRVVDVVAGVASCLEAEDALLDTLPQASEIAIVNVGGKAVPVVCTQDDLPLLAEEWQRATRGLDADLASPVYLPWDDVPRTSTFKVRRLALAQMIADRQSAPVLVAASGDTLSAAGS
jgi:acyl-coenzyme A synthetase/AMP-(fatty) acid ligase